MTSYVLTTNLIDGATVTVTSEATGFEKENAYDWNTFDSWKPTSSGTVYYTVDFGSAKTIDSWSCGFFDIHVNAGSVQPQYSNDNFSSNIVDFDGGPLPQTGDLIAFKVASVSTRYFRFKVISVGSPSNIGFFWVGEALALQRGMQSGFVDPKLARDKKIMNSKSETGQPLGSTVIQNGLKFNISQKDVTKAWIDANWDTLINHLEDPNRFVFIWDEENQPNNAVFCWVSGEVSNPIYNNPNHLDFSIPCRGLIS